MRFNFDGLLQGEIRQTYQAVYGDPDNPEDQVLEDVNENVTLAVRELVREYKAAVKLADKRAMELRDLKTRKWWDELELVSGKNGEAVVVRTHYQLEMKQMSLHLSPELMRSMRPTFTDTVEPLGPPVTARPDFTKAYEYERSRYGDPDHA